MAADVQPRKLCFVVGPIGAEDSETRTHADWLLEEIIQPVMADFPDFRVKRADQDHRPGLIDAQLISDLLTAELVIADLSALNPNAFYEIGIRHMAQKPIIHMQLAGESIPFDVSLYRAIKFSRARPRDLRAAQDALKAQVRAVLADDYQVENPVTHARGRVHLDEHATPEMRVLSDEIAALRARMDSMEASAVTTGGLLTPTWDALLKANVIDANSPQRQSIFQIITIETEELSPEEYGQVIRAVSLALPSATVSPDGATKIRVAFHGLHIDLVLGVKNISAIRGVKAIHGLGA